IVVVETRGERRGPILVNPRFEKLLGIPGETALSWSPERFHEEVVRLAADPGELRPLLAAPAEDADSLALVFQLSGPDRRFLELSCGPYRNSRGEVTGRVYSFRDITERR